MYGEKIEPGSDDFYYFYFEDDDFANYRMTHPFSEGWQADDRPQPKYFCPQTGAHFEVGEMCKRINEVGNMRAKLEAVWKRRALIEQQAAASRNQSRGQQRFRSVNPGNVPEAAPQPLEKATNHKREMSHGSDPGIS